MGAVTRWKYIEVPVNYWESSLNSIKWIMKESNAKAIKRNK
jgi:hypothetical protein